MDGHRRPVGAEAEAETGRRVAAALSGILPATGRRAAARPPHVRPARLFQNDDRQSAGHRERPQLHRRQGLPQDGRFLVFQTHSSSRFKVLILIAELLSIV